MKQSINPKKTSLPQKSPTNRFSQTKGDHQILWDQKGFSLTELLIVIALVAILLMIAIPSINTLVNKTRLTGGTRLVWSDLQNAKMTAIKTNASVTITFNSTTNYSFPSGGGATFIRNMATEYPNITVTKTGGGTIIFSSNGMMTTPSPTATLTVQSTAGTRTITIFTTGRITIT